MTNDITPIDALLDVLRSISASPEHPIVMYEIGLPMIVERKYTQNETMNALYWLQSQGVIELLEGNRLRLLKPLVAK